MSYAKITVEINNPEKGTIRQVFAAAFATVTHSRDVDRQYQPGSPTPELKPSKHTHLTVEAEDAYLVSEESSPSTTLEKILSGQALTEEEIRNLKIDLPGAVATDLGKKVKEEASKMKEEAPPPPTTPYSGIEGYIHELGATVRECLDCGCLVPGGPTRCKRCAKEAAVEGEADKTVAELLNKEANKMAAEEEIKQQSKMLQEKLDEPGAKEKISRACHEYIMDRYRKHTFLPGDYQSIEKDLVELINKQSRENRSNTPDFILAQFMARCLKAAEDAINARDKFWKDSRPTMADMFGTSPIESALKDALYFEDVRKVMKEKEAARGKLVGEGHAIVCDQCKRSFVGPDPMELLCPTCKEKERKQSMAKEPFKNPDWPLHCVVCGKVITRPQVIDGIRKGIGVEHSAPGRTTVIVKCQTCGTELGVTMEKAELISVEVNPGRQGLCLRDPNGSIQIRFANYEEADKWLTENAGKQAMHYPKGGVYRIEVGVGGTDNCIIFDIGPEGSSADDLLKAAADTLRKFGMKATMKPLDNHPYPLELEQGIVEEALKEFEEEK